MNVDIKKITGLGCRYFQSAFICVHLRLKVLFFSPLFEDVHRRQFLAFEEFQERAAGR
jgi:hypothetical protein